MYVIRICWVICMMPFAWAAAIRCRSKSFDKRYVIIRRWCLRVLSALHVPFSVKQAQPLPEDIPIFFVSNHQGTIDPLVIIAAVSTPLTFVSKKENQRLPMVSSISKTLELIYFDRDDTSSAIHMLRESARYLKRKQNLLIFPEGKRSKGKALLPFKEGALKPAYLGRATIVPITQINSYAIGSCIKQKQRLEVIIHDPIPYSDYRDLDMSTLCMQVEQIIQSGFSHDEQNVT